MKSVTALAALAALSALTAAPAFAAIDAPALAKSKNCLACHSVDAKIVGPAYKDVAAKYAGQKDAATMLADKIMKGGAGVWGPVAMPPNQVTPEEAKALAAWVLSQKK